MHDSLKLAPILTLLLAGQVLLATALPRLETPWTRPAVEDREKWNPELLRALTFGHWPAVVDWLWLRALQDDAMSHVPEGTHPKAYYDLDLATELDPAFREAHVHGANFIVVVRDDALGAKELLEKAERFRKERLPGYPQEFKDTYWRQRWMIPIVLAYVHLFELDDLPSAAEAFLEAAKIPGAPPYIESLEKRLRAPGGQYEVGLRLVNMMITQASSDEAKAKLERKRDSVYLLQYLFHLNAELDAFRARPGAPADSGKLWREFKIEKGVADADPWGGTISLDEEGRVVSSTPIEPVFGLEKKGNSE